MWHYNSGTSSFFPASRQRIHGKVVWTWRCECQAAKFAAHLGDHRAALAGLEGQQVLWDGICCLGGGRERGSWVVCTCGHRSHANVHGPAPSGGSEALHRVNQNSGWIIFWRPCLSRKTRKIGPSIQGFSQLPKTRLDGSESRSLHLWKVKIQEQMRNHISNSCFGLSDVVQDARGPFKQELPGQRNHCPVLLALLLWVSWPLLQALDSNTQYQFAHENLKCDQKSQLGNWFTVSLAIVK